MTRRRHRAGTSRSRLVGWLAALTLLFAVVVVTAMSVGPFPIPFVELLRIMIRFGGSDTPVADPAHIVVWELRFPRVALGTLVGMALAVSGAALQGLFRNPMADPGIIGASAGGAAGAVVAMALGLNRAFPLALPGAAFAGALGAVLLVYGVARVRGRLSIPTVLLAGLTVTSFLTAVISLVMVLVPSDAVVREMVFWLAGGLDAASWPQIWLTAPFLVAGTAVIVVLARDVNLLTYGDDEAQALGIRIHVVRPALIAATALVTGSAVSVSGTIGFVGLIVPHMFRVIVGADNRILIPVSALGGALFLVSADTLARGLAPPLEIRVGIITALVGAPFFLWLLLRYTRRIGA